MKKIVSLIVLSFTFCQLFSQITFQKGFTGTAGYGLGYYAVQTHDNGYILAGATTQYGAGGFDAYLIKTDSLADTLWTRTFGLTGDEGFYYVQQTSDLGYIATGFTTSAGSVDVYLVKTDSAGSLQWSKTYGGTAGMEQSYSVQQTTDGGYIIEGFTTSFGAGQYDVYLIKTDSLGNAQWTKAYGGTNFDNRNSVKQTPDGGYIMAGQTLSFGAGNGDVYVVKTDSAGTVLWSKTYGGVTGNEGAAEIYITPDGGYVFAGSTSSFSAAADYSVYLIRTDSQGNLLWSKTYGSTGFDTAQALGLTSDGGYIIAGTTTSFGAVDFDLYFIKTDSLGNVMWSKSMGSTGNDQATSVMQTTDGGYVLAGITNSFGLPVFNIYVIKTDSLGNSGGCSTQNTATITVTPVTLVNIPPTITTTPNTLVGTPATVVGSGGHVTNLCTTGLNEVASDNNVSVYPNPTAGRFVIALKNTANATAEVTDILGTTVFTSAIINQNKIEVNLSNVSAGIYFVKVTDGEKQYVKRLIVDVK